MWSDLPATVYPYTPAKHLIRRFNDPYQRNLASLLASNAALSIRLTEGEGERHQLRFPTTIDNVVYTMGKIARVSRICTASMSAADFQSMYKSLFRSYKRKGFEAFFIDFMGRSLTQISGDLPDLNVLDEFMITTLSSTGHVVIFFVFPSRLSIEAFCTSPVQLDEIQVPVERLLGLLKQYFNRNFTIKRRLQLSRDFHNDPIFMAYYLSYALSRHDQYLDTTHRLIFQFKVMTISSFIVDVHDRYLGLLRLQDLNASTFPFYTTDFKNVDNFTQIERNGWHAIDVLGDGNCGYYSLLLGLQNVGITTFHINTSEDPPQQRLQRWRQQSLTIRQRLKSASEELLTKVWPVDHPGRTLLWWTERIGAPLDDDKDELSDAFVIPKNSKVEMYHTIKFKEDPKWHFYHMDPYWGPLCAAYHFKVRVVVITRNCRPIDKKKEDEMKKKGKIADHENPEHNDYEDPDKIDLDDNGRHFYSTIIIDFDDNFDEHTDTYNPITYHNCIYRISDAEYKHKKTIELLFMTGFKAPDKEDEEDSDDNTRKKKGETKKKKEVVKNSTRHFLFLRRVLCSGVKNDYSWNNWTMKQFIEMHGTSRTSDGSPPNVSTETLTESIRSPGTGPNNSIDSTATADGSFPNDASANAAAPSPASVPNNSNESTALEVATTTPTVGTGKQFPPAKGKRGKTVNEKSPNKVVTKKKQQAKVNRKTSKAKAAKEVITNVPRRDQNAREEDDHEGSVSSIDNHDYMFDSNDGQFYRGILNGKLKRYLEREVVADTSVIDANIINEAKKKPNTWVSPTIGDPWDGPPPAHLTTKVKTLYEQLNDPFCLSYSLASCLFYCGFRSAAEWLYSGAKELAQQMMIPQIDTIVEFMPNNAPAIGKATYYEKRPSGNHRSKRPMTWNDLFTDITPYPTLVIPVRSNGRMNHAFCVVDDLIFDASTPYALKLTMESVRWIFDDDDVEIFMALRFDQKTSPSGIRLNAKYKRKVTYHWDRGSLPSETPSKPSATPTSTMENKVYDIEYISQENPCIDEPFLNRFMEIDVTPCDHR